MQPFARFVEREPVSNESCEKQSAALGYQRGRVETRFLLKNQGLIESGVTLECDSSFGDFGGLNISSAAFGPTASTSFSS